jgi:hypothetical protein
MKKPPRRIGPPKEIRIAVRCVREPEKHAKVLRIAADIGREFAETLAGLLDGTSEHYVLKPGPGSPIGKCGMCGAALETEVYEKEGEDPERWKPDANA